MIRFTWSLKIFLTSLVRTSPQRNALDQKRINRAFDQEEFDGVVITHGTDTLEETAFFLDSTIPRGMPIVLTGAMRSSNELGTDGIYNFLSALRVAADDASHDRGVLVVMNDEIHSARYVTKHIRPMFRLSRHQRTDQLA